MTDLAHFINSTRLNVSKILNHWNDTQLIELSRQEIIVPNPKSYSCARTYSEKENKTRRKI